MGAASLLRRIGSDDGRFRPGGVEPNPKGRPRGDARGGGRGRLIMELSGKRILVTGGGGFLGSHLLEALRAAGAGHICAARRHGVEKTVVLGTICAYPKFTPVPFREQDLWAGYPEETNAPYGIAKKALLVQCQTYREQYGMNAVFLLPVNLYGPRDNFDLGTSHVIPALIRKCIEARETGRQEVELWGDGTPTREFLYVKDAAEAIVTATAAYDGAEPVNIGSGEEISIFALAEKIASLTGFNGRFLWNTSQPNGQPRRCLDTTRAAREFGFRASTTLDQGLRETIAWYTEHRRPGADQMLVAHFGSPARQPKSVGLQ